MPGAWSAAPAALAGTVDMIARYIVQHEDRTLLVSVTEEKNGYRVEIDDESVLADYRAIGGGAHRSLILDGRSFEVATQSGRTGLDVFVSGEVYHMKVTDELWARAEEAAQGGGVGGEEILAPMPGAVVKINVKKDQIVLMEAFGGGFTWGSVLMRM